MKNMIRASFFKLFHDKAIWISLAGTVAWSLFLCFALIWISDGKLILTNFVTMERYWRDFIGYHAIMVPLLVSSIVLFTSEFKDRSWKLFIARGISKASFYFSKVPVILFLTALICFVSILTGAVFSLAALGAPMSKLYLGFVLRFYCLQVIAHGTAAILILSISFLIKVSEISSSLNMVLLVLGTMALSKLEGALFLGDALTGSWAFAQPLRVCFAQWNDVLRFVLTFAVYLVVCSLVVILFTARRDVE